MNANVARFNDVRCSLLERFALADSTDASTLPQAAEVIQITGKSYRMRGQKADQKNSTDPNCETEGKSKTGQKRPPAPSE